MNKYIITWDELWTNCEHEQLNKCWKGTTTMSSKRREMIGDCLERNCPILKGLKKVEEK